VRPLAGADRIHALLQALGREASEPTAAYLTGGATAVLLGWRETTIDVDLRFEPERDELLRAVSRLKDELQINVELASPADFIPVPDGVESRAMMPPPRASSPSTTTTSTRKRSRRSSAATTATLPTSPR
jgi:hypothetical protein